ncbi:hypothetical protein R1flu_015950 [Riccia fluitans]|uniref:Uncharacterized protein n=1 Tax=Riccia fluitans TaxID=41844 RepID=A0ABD1YKF4_9MARC
MPCHCSSSSYQGTHADWRILRRVLVNEKGGRPKVGEVGKELVSGAWLKVRGSRRGGSSLWRGLVLWR